MNNLTKQATMEHTFEYNDENIVINIKEEEYQHYKELAVRIIVEREKDIQVRIKNNCRNDETDFYFYEIYTIDGIFVSVIMKIDQIRFHELSKGYRVFLKITDSNDYDKRFMSQFLQTKIKKITIDVIIGCLIQMKHILSNIKFNNIECEFQHIKKIENKMKKRENIISIFQSDNVKMRGDMCSVCHEFTQKKLTCFHHLCVRCFQHMREKLIKETDDQEEPDDLKCPICRGEFSMYSYY